MMDVHALLREGPQGVVRQDSWRAGQRTPRPLAKADADWLHFEA